VKIGEEFRRIISPVSRQTMPLAPGSRLGAYEVRSPLGAGGMGEVYKARDTRLDRTVAIKVLPEQSAGDPAFRERFEREAARSRR
jgi:serine/threonine protein kinase